MTQVIAFLCDATNDRGRPLHTKPTLAKFAKVRSSSKPPRSSETLFAKVPGDSETFVWLDGFVCGIHADKRQTFLQAPVEELTGDRDHDLSVALVWYGKEQEAVALRHAENALLYAKHKRDDAGYKHIIVANPRPFGEVSWDIVDTVTNRGVTSISVHREGGLLFAQTSDYGGHTGRGRGSLNWLMCLKQALVLAEDYMRADKDTMEASLADSPSQTS